MTGTDVDLVVAGAGGGLAGALRAAQLGARVLVVEANEHFLRGNNTSMSTAMVPGAGSRWQRDAGIDDSPERFLADIAAKTHGDFATPVAEALAGVSAELVEWLADHAGLPIELPTDFHYPGHSAQRVHSIPGRHGARLLRHLADAVSAEPLVDLMVPARITAARTGVVTVSYPDGGEEEITTRALLLATNGYGANRELVAEYLPEIADAEYHGSEYSTGDALRIGATFGAQKSYLDAYQGHAGLSAEARTLVTWTVVMHGGFVTTVDGRRFGDESTGYSEYAATLAAQPGSTGWLVYDERIHDASLAFGDYVDVVESGAPRRAESVADLAATIGVPADTLQAELDEAAAVAHGELARDRFGRTEFERPLAAPFYAVRILPALFHTQGGLTVDRHARVLGSDGEPIPGLYASGGAAVSISGHGAAGYLAGNGLLPALGLAYLAAAHTAATLPTVKGNR
ncbi:FAD-dependent oxidoreductase [Amycolatopsis sp.]|uniref:FAD-dependent oxidoreductase n=1 Tax=Amycolatopsis sp. TaxID=37632 RepID=UPI002B576DF0|nr:FAD-binding protein [Amycolatopsis sp.]HVV09488.1 FAD-binding protein [Amycolatopsis sp.]